MRVLALNAGSSSLKSAMFDVEGERATRLASESVSTEAGHGEAAKRAIEAFAARGLSPDAFGHRFVHGGPRHRGPAVLDIALREELDSLVELAPLHMPIELAVVDAAARARPKLAHVICFDTAFHRDIPDVAGRFPLAQSFYDKGLMRYGFHGLSYEHAVRTIGAAALGRAVLAHLGNGASMAAVNDGRSIDTTMGLTPTGGLVMGTRSGDLDPGLVLHLLAHGHSPESLDDLVNHQAGLRGVSGGTSDMKTLLAARATDPRADLAVRMFAYAARKTIGAYAAALGGLDTLLFTGGIGEHAPAVRAMIGEGLEHLGVTIDAAKNEANADRIERGGARVAVRVVAADEEQMIARHVADALAGASGSLTR